LPPGADGQAFQIKFGMLRGVPSQGMLCSAKELKIADRSPQKLRKQPRAGLLQVQDELKQMRIQFQYPSSTPRKVLHEC
jgi:tRNA-binding EMAP/Myf-like protein